MPARSAGLRVWARARRRVAGRVARSSASADEVAENPRASSARHACRAASSPANARPEHDAAARRSGHGRTRRTPAPTARAAWSAPRFRAGAPGASRAACPHATARGRKRGERLGLISALEVSGSAPPARPADPWAHLDRDRRFRADRHRHAAARPAQAQRRHRPGARARGRAADPELDAEHRKLRTRGGHTCGVARGAPRHELRAGRRAALPHAVGARRRDQGGVGAERGLCGGGFLDGGKASAQGRRIRRSGVQLRKAGPRRTQSPAAGGANLRAKAKRRARRAANLRQANPRRAGESTSSKEAASETSAPPSSASESTASAAAQTGAGGRQRSDILGRMTR